MSAAPAVTQPPDAANTNTDATTTSTTEILDKAEEEHEYDAVTTLFINLCIICCLLLAYYVKKFRIYSFPESAGALLVGVIIGGIARLSTDNLSIFEFVRTLLVLGSSHHLHTHSHTNTHTLDSPPIAILLYATVTRGILLCALATLDFRSGLQPQRQRFL
jgi:hypothetical protein